MRYPIPTESEISGLRRDFQESQAINDLLNESVKKTGIAASDLYAFTKGEQGKAQEILAAMQSNTNLQVAYRGMIEAISIYKMPEAIAASSEEFPTRQASGCQIKVEKSRAEESQYYIIITVSDMDRIAPKLMTVIDQDNNIERLELPVPRRGIIQVSTDEKSGIPLMLINPKTAIYLG